MFRGTPPTKPLNCKSVSNRLGARIRSAWAHHTGGTSFRSCASIRLALSDITRTSLCYRSQTFHLSLLLFIHFRENKKPRLLCGKQGWRNPLSIFRTCLHRVYPNYLRAPARSVPRIVQGETHNPNHTGYDGSLSRPSLPANSWLICLSKFSSNVYDEYYRMQVTVHLYFPGQDYFTFEYPNGLMRPGFLPGGGKFSLTMLLLKGTAEHRYPYEPMPRCDNCVYPSARKILNT